MNSTEHEADYEFTCQIDPTTLTVIVWTRHTADPLVPGEVRLGRPSFQLDSEQQTYLSQVLTAFIRNPDVETAAWTEQTLCQLGFELVNIAAVLNTLRANLRSL